MKTIFALFVGDKVIAKSERYRDLIHLREMTPGSYITYWIGRIKLQAVV